MASRLPGYSRGGRFNRGYISPTGENISYRQYRQRVEAANAVQHLDALRLAVQRRKQKEFNHIIDHMTKVQKRSLNQALEMAKQSGDKETARKIVKELKTVKSTAIKSPSRKTALEDLKAFRRATDPIGKQRLKEALILLGRRDGIPDWVEVGESDAYRKGTLKRPASTEYQRIRRKG